MSAGQLPVSSSLSAYRYLHILPSAFCLYPYGIHPLCIWQGSCLPASLHSVQAFSPFTYYIFQQLLIPITYFPLPLDILVPEAHWALLHLDFFLNDRLPSVVSDLFWYFSRGTLSPPQWRWRTWEQGSVRRACGKTADLSASS